MLHLQNRSSHATANRFIVQKCKITHHQIVLLKKAESNQADIPELPGYVTFIKQVFKTDKLCLYS